MFMILIEKLVKNLTTVFRAGLLCHAIIAHKNGAESD